MAQVPAIRVDYGEHLFQSPHIGNSLLTLSLQRRYGFMEQRDGPFGRIAPVGLHISAQETNASRIVLQADLVRMQFQLQFFAEKPPDLRHQFFQMVPAFVYDVEIIDITSIVFAAQAPLHVLVQSPQINVAEKPVSYTHLTLPTKA